MTLRAKQLQPRAGPCVCVPQAHPAMVAVVTVPYSKDN